MVSFSDRHLCSRPGTVYYGLRYFCKEHIEVTRADEDANHAHQALYYLR